MEVVEFEYDSQQYFLKCHSDLIKRIISENQTYFEDWLLTPLKEKVSSFDFIIDVGSNIGNHAHFFSNVCKAKKVICFEPLPENFELLKENCPECILYQSGLSSRTGEGFLNKHEDINKNSGTAKIDTSGLSVELNTLDIFEFKGVTFIKIDVEGHELEVLKGATQTIESSKPDILVETHSGITPEDVLQLLPNGYNFERLGHETHYLYKHSV